MPFLPKQWFWFISHAKLARIVEAKDRQEANKLYNERYPEQEDLEQKVLLTMPAEKCPHCGNFVQPIGGYIKDLWYAVPICKEDDHTQYVPVLGELAANT